MEDSVIEKYYNYMGNTFKVLEKKSFHERLENDNYFAAEFLSQVLSQSQNSDIPLQVHEHAEFMTQVSSQSQNSELPLQVHEHAEFMTQVSSQSQNSGLPLQVHEHANKENHIVENEEPVTVNSNAESAWDNNNIKLLLDEYLKRLEKFDSGKVKKKVLWREISDIFRKHGKMINCADIERKFRNLTSTYKRIKNNNDTRKTTGRGRVSWEWFNYYEEIFGQNKSFNFTNEVISSFPMDKENVPTNNTKSTNVTKVDGKAANSSMELMRYKNNSTEHPQNNSTEHPQNNIPQEDCEFLSSDDDNKKGPSKRLKALKSRKLYGQRNQQLINEKNRNDILCRINKNIEKFTSITAQNALSWREGVDACTKAINERTNVLSEFKSLFEQFLNRKQ